MTHGHLNHTRFSTILTDVIPADHLARADEAVTWVLSAFPNHASAHFVRGEVLRARKELDAAIAEFEIAISINPVLRLLMQASAMPKSALAEPRKRLHLLRRPFA
jgi:tetratricopeptide (TPR) repeat protein